MIDLLFRQAMKQQRLSLGAQAGFELLPVVLLITKSAAGSPGPLSLGLTPLYAGTRLPCGRPGQ